MSIQKRNAADRARILAHGTTPPRPIQRTELQVGCERANELALDQEGGDLARRCCGFVICECPPMPTTFKPGDRVKLIAHRMGPAWFIGREGVFSKALPFGLEVMLYGIELVRQVAHPEDLEAVSGVERAFVGVDLAAGPDRSVRSVVNSAGKVIGTSRPIGDDKLPPGWERDILRDAFLLIGEDERAGVRRSENEPGRWYWWNPSEGGHADTRELAMCAVLSISVRYADGWFGAYADDILAKDAVRALAIKFHDAESCARAALAAHHAFLKGGVA